MASAELSAGSARNTLYGVARMIVDAMGKAFATGDEETAHEMDAVGRRILTAVGYTEQDVTGVMWKAAVARERDERGMDLL